MIKKVERKPIEIDDELIFLNSEKSRKNTNTNKVGTEERAKCNNAKVFHRSPGFEDIYSIDR